MSLDKGQSHVMMATPKEQNSVLTLIFKNPLNETDSLSCLYFSSQSQPLLKGRLNSLLAKGGAGKVVCLSESSNLKNQHTRKGPSRNRPRPGGGGLRLPWGLRAARSSVAHLTVLICCKAACPFLTHPYLAALPASDPALY